METPSKSMLLRFCFFLLLISPCFAQGSVSGMNEPCNGSIAECDQDLESFMESDITRRFLAGKRYISPGALKRDQPVCNGGARGQSYSSSGGCLPPPANPYNRGCSKIYRCRGDS